MLTKEKFIEVERKVIETVEKLNKIYAFNMKNPPIFFDVTGTNGGLAKYRSMSVHFNTRLALDNWEDFLQSTVPHEVCHIAVWHWAKFFNKPIPSAHGATWKLMMWEVGAKPRRTHEYDVEEVARKVAIYEYDCRCEKPTEVSIVIHNKIKKGHVYSCRKCGTILKNGLRKLTIGFSEDSPNGTTLTRKD